MIKIGAGYQPMCNKDSVPLPLPFPKQVTLVEVGLAEYLKASLHVPKSTAISLHLARTPITETADIQDEFINHLVSKLDSKRLPVSIGLHLTNERQDGIGKYGFSSHYVMSSEREELAFRFMERLHRESGLPIWLENANFYSTNPLQAFSAWHSFSRILEGSDAHAIVDLSHLLIDAKNIGLSPEAMLGAVPWSRVVEIHISGVTVGTDGAYHDGHSYPVHAGVWDLLDQIISCGLCPTETTVFTIEHTDPSWVRQRDIYLADFDRLEKLLEAEQSKMERYSKASRSEQYAHSFLMKTVLRQIPKLSIACEQRGIKVEKLFNDWIDKTINREKRRILLTSEEVPAVLREKHALAARDFLEFSRERMAAHENRY